MAVQKKPWMPVDLRLPAELQASLGILAFEVAVAMSKQLSVHRSLSDQVSRLCSDAMRSAGVAYLNSSDHAFLLRLACAELVVSLYAAEAAVARLGLRCGIDFGGVYACLMASAPDARLDAIVAKGLRVEAKKMERLVAATDKLYFEMEIDPTEHRAHPHGRTIHPRRQRRSCRRVRPAPKATTVVHKVLCASCPDTVSESTMMTRPWLRVRTAGAWHANV